MFGGQCPKALAQSTAVKTIYRTIKDTYETKADSMTNAFIESFMIKNKGYFNVSYQHYAFNAYWTQAHAIDVIIYAFERHKNINRTLANCFFLNRQYRDAIYQYQRLMAAGDTTFLGLYSVGMSYNYLGNKQQAYDYLLQAVKKNDKSAGCNYRLGIVCIDLERHEEALKYLFDAEYLLQPDRIIMKVIHDHKAKAYYAQGKYIWAIESWKKARECDGTSLAFIYNIGSCYAALYETAKADGTFDGHPINVAQMLEQARNYYGLFLEMATDNGDEPDEETQEMIQSARQYLEQAQE